MTFNATTQASQDREIVVSRLVGAPRELVWKALTEPTHLKEWWGPFGFTTTTKEFSFKPGGKWRFTMHGPDGTDYPNRIVFEDIDEPNYLCYVQSGEGDFDDIKFDVVVTLEPVDGNTNVTLRSTFATKQARDLVIEKHGALEGAIQHLVRLDLFVNGGLKDLKKKLDITLPSETEVQFTRDFDAPRELVWNAWTEPAHLQQWMTGPEGWTMEVVENNFHPGGTWTYVWRRAGGTEMSMHGVFKEIVPPEKLVSSENWGDPWPESVNHLVLLEHEGGTKMILTIMYPSESARDAATQTGMTDGMSMSFGRLDTLLSKLQ